MRKLGCLLCGVALAMSVAACGSVSSPSTQTAEDYTDTVQPAGQVFKTFSVGKTGEMQFTLQSLTPRLVVGFLAVAIGQPTGSVCSPFPAYIVQQTAVGQQYSFPQITKGTYCILVADGSSALTQAATFTLHFTHP